MRYPSPDPFLLLGFCSYCGEDFRNGVPRFLVGDFPMEQFCSYKCASNFLQYDLGEEQAVPTGSAIYRPDPPLRQERREKS
jgi:hypothetical protein